MFACTACIDINFEYRFPYGGWAILVALVWFGSNAIRTTDESPKAKRILILIGLLLATAWFTLCMVPQAWGGLLGAVTGASAIRAIVDARSSSARKRVAGIVIVALLGLLSFSLWTSKRTEHQIAWLGRLPTHGAENIRPVHFIRSRGAEIAPELIRTAEQEINNLQQKNWYHLGSLARELGRMPDPPCAIIGQFRDRAIQLIQEEDGFSVGLPVAILACGQVASCTASSSFEPLIRERLSNKDPSRALLLLTAWGLSDRDSALEWAAQQDLSSLESSDSFLRNDGRAIHELWKHLKAGRVDPVFVQKQLDRMTPACGL